MRSWFYSVRHLINSPVGTTETVEEKWPDGNTVVTISVLPDNLLLQVTGEIDDQEICARCGKDTAIKIPLSNTYEVSWEESDDYSVKKDGTIPLHDIIQEEIELKRPAIVYCKECSKE